MFGFTLLGLYSDEANSFLNHDGVSGILGLSAKVIDMVTVTVAKDIQWRGDDSCRGSVNWAVAPGFNILLEASYGDSVGDKAKTGMLPSSFRSSSSLILRWKVRDSLGVLASERAAES